MSDFLDVFNRIEKTYRENYDHILEEDVLSALTEELGEYSRAVRVEEKAVICFHKGIKKASKVEAIDILLVAIEAFLLRGGESYQELLDILNMKCSKWEKTK